MNEGAYLKSARICFGRRSIGVYCKSSSRRTVGVQLSFDHLEAQE